jgi:hypothetical protein
MHQVDLGVRLGCCAPKAFMGLKSRDRNVPGAPAPGV